MGCSARIVDHGPPALAALRASIDELQAGDPLAAVTVVVPSNAVGVAARRWLAAHGGIAAAQFVTMFRLAELLGAPALVGAGRRPVSTPVVDVAVRHALQRAPGSFAPVAHHHATVRALREVHRELRHVAPAALANVAEHGSRRAAEVVRLHHEIVTELAAGWYDEADLLLAAIRALPAAPPPVVVHLPDRLRPTEQSLLDALAERTEVRVHEGSAALRAAGTVEVVDTSDADEEVREVVRRIVAAADAGVALERIAVVWPVADPYARLVAEHLDAAGISWNGRPGVDLHERLAARAVLDVLDIDRRGLRRSDLFDVLAHVPARRADGQSVPAARWERISRTAGLAAGTDWDGRLARHAQECRDGGRADEAAAADALGEFVDDLRARLGPPGVAARWQHWAGVAGELLDRWLGGPRRIAELPPVELDAYEQVEAALVRLGQLDSIDAPVTRRVFADALAAELDSTPGRVGRIGDGVLVGPLGFATGQALDHLYVLGVVEGQLPSTPRPDPLLGDADRALAGGQLTLAADGAVQQRHRFVAAVAAAGRVVVLRPRGDLRTTADRQPSRWIAELAGATPLVEHSVSSFAGGLADAPFPAVAGHHRIRALVHHRRRGQPIDAHPLARELTALRRGLAMVRARESAALTEFDGDLTGLPIPSPLDGTISPTALERWVRCPYAYFVHHLLGVRPVEQPDVALRIRALDLGSLVHDALDRFHRRVIAGELPQPGADGWSAGHLAAADAELAAAGARYEAAGRVGRPAMWASSQATMRNQLRRWLIADGARLAARHATVVASELSFGQPWDPDTRAAVPLDLPGGRVLQLNGQVDRIDRGADGSLYVTDHKTGKRDGYTGINDERPMGGGDRCSSPSTPRRHWRSPTATNQRPLCAPSTRSSSAARRSEPRSSRRRGPTSACASGRSSTASPAGCSSPCHPGRSTTCRGWSASPAIPTTWARPSGSRSSTASAATHGSPRSSARRPTPVTGAAMSDATDLLGERHPPDQPARVLVAEALGTNLFVSAGAGSGKTTALIARVVNLVLDGVPITEIAAVTFTEKAAAELRHRLRLALAAPPPGASPAQAALAAAALADLDHAPIGTLHAFARRLLAEFPIESRLPPRFEVLDEVQSAIAFEERYADFVEALLDDPAQVRLVDLCEHDRFRLDRGARRMAQDFQDNWDLVEERVALTLPTPADLELDDLVERCRSVAATPVPPADRQAELVARVAELGRRLADEPALGEVFEVLAELRKIKPKGWGNKAQWKAAGLGEAALDALRAAERELADAAAQRVVDLDAERRLTLGALLAGFTLDAVGERRAAGRLEFHDLLVLARQLLADHPHVRGALHQRYTRILLDEFQDTDPIQLELALRITAEPEDQDADWARLRPLPGRLCVVGDAKQSIYRFRRADIAQFLGARDQIGATAATLSANFRSTPAVIDWVNHTMSRLIEFEPDVQPAYEPLTASRTAAAHTGSVHVLGLDPHDDSPTADDLRAREAADVADIVVRAVVDGWPVARRRADGSTELVPCGLGDIAVLLPARTSLPALQVALAARDIPYRAENSSLVYAAPEIRSLLLALRGADDPTDELAIVSALRTPLYGCSDRDLFDWRVTHGLRWRWEQEVPTALADHPVAEGLASIGRLAARIPWSTPSELLAGLVDERAVLELALATRHGRDVWRRVRYVVDQARAWSEAGGHGVRRYLTWTRLAGRRRSLRRRDRAARDRPRRRPGDDGARGEGPGVPDHDRVRSHHAADELAGRARRVAGGYVDAGEQRRRGVRDVQARRRADERQRAAPAAVRRHHSGDGPPRRLPPPQGRRHRRHVGAVAGRRRRRRRAPDPRRRQRPACRRRPLRRPSCRGPTRRRGRRAARRLSLRRHGRRCSAPPRSPAARVPTRPPTRRCARTPVDLDLAPWQRGRYGTAVGRAVHAVLQHVDLAAGRDLAVLAASQAAAEGVLGLESTIEALARSALGAPIVRGAVGHEHWRELFVATAFGEHVVEGYIDLLVRHPGRGLVVVDYKTDQIDPTGDGAVRLARYGRQLAAYGIALESLLGEPVAAGVIVLCRTAGEAEEVEIGDWSVLQDELRAGLLTAQRA